MSRRAGARREYTQTASPNGPVEIFHTIGVLLSLWMGSARGQESSFSHEFDLFCEFELFKEFCKIHKFCDRCLVTGCKSVMTWWEKIVLCIACFQYALLLPVVVFLLLSYWTVFISTQEFYLFTSSPPHPSEGEGEGWASRCLVLSCQLLG